MKSETDRLASALRVPSVAVLLAAHNGVRWLTEQLDSIDRQVGVRITLFVSVDASSDGTEAWLARHAAIRPWVVLLPNGVRSGGPGQNFIRLFREVDFSPFDFVALADQDDIWRLDKLQRACDLLFEHDADAYSSNVEAFWPDGRRVLVRKAHPQRDWDFLFEAAGPGCTYVVRSELARRFQTLLFERPDEIRQVGLHDWFLYAFARAKGYRWLIDSRPGMLYRQHEQNGVGVNRGMRAFRERVEKVASGWAIEQAALIARLVQVDECPFVRRWLAGGRSGVLWLALNAGQCRRSPRDRLLFVCACLVLFVRGRRRV